MIYKNYNIIDINAEVKDFSIELLHKYGSSISLRAMDAMQLSGALFLHQLLKVDFFICSDKKFINIAKNYFNTFDPED